MVVVVEVTVVEVPVVVVDVVVPAVVVVASELVVVVVPAEVVVVVASPPPPEELQDKTKKIIPTKRINIIKIVIFFILTILQRQLKLINLIKRKMMPIRTF